MPRGKKSVKKSHKKSHKPRKQSAYNKFMAEYMKKHHTKGSGAAHVRKVFADGAKAWRHHKGKKHSKK